MIPTELTDLKIWHCWINFNGTKVPLQVSGAAAKSNSPDTWTSFEKASQAAEKYSGLALEIVHPYCGIDLDNCLDEKGNLREWALPIVARLSAVSYGEVSPSGTGIKFITRARKPQGSRCLHKVAAGQQLECYDKTRFWAITHNVYCDDLDDGQAVVDWLCETYLSGPEQATTEVKCEPALPRENFSSLMDRAIGYVDGAAGATKGDLRNSAFRLAGHLHKLTDEFGQRLTDDEVLNLLRTWNPRNSPPLKDKELQEAARNGRKNGTARAASPPQLIIRDNSDVDLSGLMPCDVCEPPSEMPEEMLDVPGLIGELARHNLETAMYPLPELALAGAIALMSTITGCKIKARRGRPNLYVMALAPSGAGKDYSRKLNRHILHHCGADKMAGPERIGSHAGIITQMEQSSSTLFQVDEIGRLLATLQDARQGHLYNISTVLMQMYSSSGSIWTADAYADVKKVKSLYYPNCVIYGSAVPDGFWASISADQMCDGLVGRFLVFEQEKYVHYQEVDDSPIPPIIMDRTKAWVEMKPHSGNLAGVFGADPREIMCEPDASDRLKQHTIAISSRRMGETKIPAAIWSRVAEKTNKLAMLFAASRYDGITWPEITLEDADKAIALNNFLTRRMLHKANLHVAETEFEREQKKVLRTIRERGEMSLTDLSTACRWLKARERNEVLGILQQSGDIVVKKVETGGRPREVVCACSPAQLNSGT